MHKVHNVRTKKQKYKIYADSQNFVFWFYQNIFHFDISPKSPFEKRGLCHCVPSGEYKGCGGLRKKKFYSGRIRKILYFGFTKIFFIFTYPLNPLLIKGDFVATLRVGCCKVFGTP